MLWVSKLVNIRLFIKFINTLLSFLSLRDRGPSSFNFLGCILLCAKLFLKYFLLNFITVLSRIFGLIQAVQSRLERKLHSTATQVAIRKLYLIDLWWDQMIVPGYIPIQLFQKVLYISYPPNINWVKQLISIPCVP